MSIEGVVGSYLRDLPGGIGESGYVAELLGTTAVVSSVDSAIHFEKTVTANEHLRSGNDTTNLQSAFRADCRHSPIVDNILNYKILDEEPYKVPFFLQRLECRTTERGNCVPKSDR